MKLIVILDCGSRFLPDLDKALQDAGVKTKILSVPIQCKTPPADARFPVFLDVGALDDINPAGVVISGTPHYLYTKQGRIPPAGFLDTMLSKNIPLLGICGGLELLTHLIAIHDTEGKPPRVIGINPSGTHEPSEISSNPCAFTRILDDPTAKSCGDIIFNGLPSSFPVWMYHVHQVRVLPAHCIAIGNTPGTKFAAIACCDPLKPEPYMFGVQFHPEVSPAKTRRQIFHNFVQCGVA